MAGFVVLRTTPPLPQRHFNRIVSRTDTPPQEVLPRGPRRTDPTMCPVDGTHSYTCDEQFIRLGGDRFECRRCGAVINAMGVILVNPITG